MLITHLYIVNDIGPSFIGAVYSCESLPLQITQSARLQLISPNLSNSKSSDQIYIVRHICLAQRCNPAVIATVRAQHRPACSARTSILVGDLTEPRAVKSAEITARVEMHIVAQHNVQSSIVLAACTILLLSAAMISGLLDIQQKTSECR
jgi:hypothetical protein